MIVRSSRAKVGHCQAPSKQKGPVDATGLFCILPAFRRIAAMGHLHRLRPNSEENRHLGLETRIRGNESGRASGYGRRPVDTALTPGSKSGGEPT
jgi:hypothetical protein